MKHNLLNKLFITTAIASALTACGGGDGNQKLYDNEVQPATFDQDITISLKESDPIMQYDLLAGVTNPADSLVVARSLKYLRVAEDEDGFPLTPEQPLFIGPALPLQAVYQSENSLFVLPGTFNPALLVHQHTIDTYGNIAFDPDPEVDGDEVLRYTEAIYEFTYLVDNGSLTETTPRKISITISGEEVKAESIESPDTFEVGEDYFAQLDAQVMPLDTTYDKLTYAVSDETKATIDENGLVSAVALGAFDITVTSEDGSVVKTIPSETVVVTQPLALDINVDGVKQSSRIDIKVESSIDFDALLLPDFNFQNDVVWTSSNPEVVSIDALTGVATALVLSNDDDEVAAGMNVVTITATVEREGREDLVKTFTLTVIEGDNLLYFADGNFESGSLDSPDTAWAPHWSNPAGAVVEISTDAAKDGMYGLRIMSDGSARTGVSMSRGNTPQVIGSGEGRYKYSFDLKVNNWDGLTNQGFRIVFVPSVWADRIELWPSVTPIDGEWVKVEAEFDASTFPAGQAYTEFQLNGTMPTGMDVYIDNVKMEAVN